MSFVNIKYNNLVSYLIENGCILGYVDLFPHLFFMLGFWNSHLYITRDI